MLTRLRLLKGATVLLYIGPLFAGISGLSWGMVVPFVGIFVVWLMVLRPEQWPATAEEWVTPQGLGAALSQVLSQLLLVSVLLALGRGLGAVAGFLPLVDPIFPLAVSFLAIPLCRILWNADEAADQGIFLDDEAEAVRIPRATAEAAKAIVPLLNLPDAAPEDEVLGTVTKVMDVARPVLQLDALAAALAKPDRSHSALRRALILWACEPERVASCLVPQGMAITFAMAQHDSGSLRQYLPRALALIAAFPTRAEDFPAPQHLREVAASAIVPAAEADLREGLLSLAAAIENALSPAAATQIAPGASITASDAAS
jgi:hypothetical protein